MFNFFKSKKRIAELEAEVDALRVARLEQASEIFVLQQQGDKLRAICENLRARIKSHGMTIAERNFLTACEHTFNSGHRMSERRFAEHMTMVIEQRGHVETMGGAGTAQPIK